MKECLLALMLSVALIESSPLTAKATRSPNNSPETPQQIVGRDISSGLSSLRDNDLAGAGAAFDRAIAAPGFKSLSEEDQYKVLDLAVRIAADTDNRSKQLRLAKLASRYSLATGDIWHLRLVAAYLLYDYADSAVCIATIARRWPRNLDKIKDQAFFTVNSELQKASASASVRIDYLQALFAAGWTLDGRQPDRLWLDLAALLLERGDSEKASAVAMRVESARGVLALETDKRFARLATRSSPSVEQSAAADIARAQARVSRLPRKLDALVDLHILMLDSMQFERVLASCDSVIAKVKEGDGTTLYDDFDRYVWVLDNRAQALQRLGRWDEAVKQETKASRRPEHGEMNVSHILNLGMLLTELGRADEAIEAVSELGTMSPYGRMQLEMVRLSAAVQRHDETDVETRLSFMRSHREDAIATYQKALVEAQRLDSAAKLLIERLRSARWQGGALEDVQDYASVPETPIVHERMAHWRMLIARPEVREVVEKVGSIQRVDLVSSVL